MSEKKPSPNAVRVAVRLSAMYKISRHLTDNDHGGPIEERLGVYMCLVSLHHSAIEEAIAILTRKDDEHATDNEPAAALH